MAIVVGTQGPKLEVARAALYDAVVAAAARHPEDDDLRTAMELANWMKSLGAELTSNDDVGFEAIYTETGLGA